MAERERDPARTRRAVLSAAARVVAAKGAGVSIDTIAREAGVSKGGLLHHFRSRDELLLAVCEDLLEQFTSTVLAAVDPADRAPGRNLRGYIRASFDILRNEPSPVEHVALVSALSNVPGVGELMLRDKQQWKDLFAPDGLDPQRVLLIMRAADGASIAGLYEGGHQHEELEYTRQLLLALTYAEEPLVQLPDAPPWPASLSDGTEPA
ncbi:TetR/AcrR family transcriptional regulator [Kineosporia rhizophila]|uniref:TetR/AcrR family transcriptional regulator n=1 Tax=Kineosporia TaxID=49184 RepID=UPI001E35C31C|nr:TetR/AcrR family transcriptional regulator [Kineosporia sp. NBRC 101677]MCE0539118.1 TetR/AcrR family transcriptional regulator [Kineosporia rhizophila]GLY18120.1 TetR family transcriptional regulator [Kineosporia sp. NBRC 101677]